jgi:hypothetical protein
MSCHVALVRTDVSEELSASFVRVTRISELGAMLAVTSNRRTANVRSSPILVTLMMEALNSSKTRFLQKPHSITSQKRPFFIYQPDIYLYGLLGRFNLKLF